MKLPKIIAIVVVAAIVVGVAVGVSLWAVNRSSDPEPEEITTAAPTNPPESTVAVTTTVAQTVPPPTTTTLPSELITFPDNFKFGAASASYQIEGAWNEDGKSPNIWDTITHKTPEYVEDSTNGDVAANSYHFYQKDIDALTNIGFEVYRFSISWSRIIPDGTTTNMLGIDYYNKLINGLLEKGIEPLVTIFHWDLPQYLQDLGGWTSPVIADYFAEYADVLFEHFGDRVKRWITVNEPSVYCQEGYGDTTKAPGIASPGVGDYLCAHNTLLAHAAAYHVYREKYFAQQGGQVGICLNAGFSFPASPSVDPSYGDKAIEFGLGMFANPIWSQEGGYPQIMVDQIANKSVNNEGRVRSRLPTMTDEEKERIRGTSDFLALNYYQSGLVTPREEDPSLPINWWTDRNLDGSVDPSWKRAKSSWLYSVPQGLHDLLVWIKNKYNNPTVLITENGWSDDGQLEDDGRVEYIREHLAAVSRAIKNEGCDVVAYTVWSLTDNFEWKKGYLERFGIHYINFISDDKERVPKKSAYFFKQMMQTKSFTLDGPITPLGSVSFPSSFKIGAASASYQVEGAWDEDGKSPNVWDTITHKDPGYVADRSNGDVAANSYHFYQKDIDALANIGFEFYRFSVSWTRILPDGTTPNMKGIEYYNKVIDGLIAKGIEPLITIYHWDTPQYVQDLGGWTSPLIVDYFTDYVDVLFEHFGDRVKRWVTVNEPNVYCGEGYGYTSKAPGISSPGVGDYLCVHHTLLANAAAYHLYKDKYFAAQGGQVGICLNTGFSYPADQSVDPSYTDKALEFDLGKYTHAIFTEEGGYPQIVVDQIANKSINEGRVRSRVPQMTQEERDYIRGTADFLAINYYSSGLVSPRDEDPSLPVAWWSDTNLNGGVDPSWKRAKSTWLYQVPEGLHDLMVWIKNKYNNPSVMIAENGWSDDGQLDDDGRVEYLKLHLEALSRAVKNEGCNVVAYTVWSLTDNFEWKMGYLERFGIHYINFNSEEKERVPKKSALFFKSMMPTKSFDL